MGISRDSRHKRRPTGGKRAIHQKKRKHELGRSPANTKLGLKRVRTVRVRGGHSKLRAIRLDHGNFSWSSEQVSHKSKIVGVVYNPVSNELVRTNTLTKGAVVTIDASPFRTWFYSRYGVELGKKKANEPETETTVDDKKKALWASRAEKSNIENGLIEQFNTGRLLACVSSRPGQVGAADGYILEGDELAFYKKKLDKKRK